MVPLKHRPRWPEGPGPGPDGRGAAQQGCHPQGSDSGEGLPKQCPMAQTLGTQAHHREIRTRPFGRS